MARPQSTDLTLTDAANLTPLSRSTLRRRREDGAFPNAYTDDDGAWRIPVTDLLAAGVEVALPDREPARQHEQALEQARDQAREQGDDRRVTDLERALAVEQERRRAAERLVAEKDAHLDDLRRALLMLEPVTGRNEQVRDHPVEQAAHSPAHGQGHEPAQVDAAGPLPVPPPPSKAGRRRWRWWSRVIA